MPLDYIQLHYHKDISEFQLYLHYIVEDRDYTNRKGELIYQSKDPIGLVKYLTKLIKNNIHMATTLKYSIGNFNQYDLLLDMVKFLGDVKEILTNLQEEHGISGLYIEYVDRYEKFFQKIIDLEMQKFLEISTRQRIAEVLLNAFQYYGEAIMIDEVDPVQMKKKCMVKYSQEGIEHNEIQEFTTIFGLPITICSQHEILVKDLKKWL